MSANFIPTQKSSEINRYTSCRSLIPCQGISVHWVYKYLYHSSWAKRRLIKPHKPDNHQSILCLISRIFLPLEITYVNCHNNLFKLENSKGSISENLWLNTSWHIVLNPHLFKWHFRKRNGIFNLNDNYWRKGIPRVLILHYHILNWQTLHG